MVGSHLAEYLLKKNYVVFALCRWNTKLNNIFHLNTFVKQKKLNLIYGDLLDESSILKALKISKPKYIFHLAAHSYPTTSFISPKECMETNIIGTLNLLEAARNFAKESPFVYLSTNKVYGDNPNRLEIVDTETRWEYSKPLFQSGIDELMSIDHCTHSLFGVSKTSADLLVQEYGKYFSMPTVCLRGGCLTGEGHKGIELHGFLSYLTKVNVTNGHYKIFGYKGKQVRDNIHSWDVANFIWHFLEAPRVGEVYNLGGGYENSCSILEAINLIEVVSKPSFDKSVKSLSTVIDNT